MKRLFIIILCVFLISCSKDGKDYFSVPRTLYVTINVDDVSLTGRLETAPDSTCFYPDEPKGMEIKVFNSGGTVSYNGLVFENSTVGMTHISALHDNFQSGNIKTVFSDNPYPDEIIADTLKLTVHKELTQ